MLGLLFGASVYALSIIVAVFLAGLGIGSGIGALLCRTLALRAWRLGWCQCLAAGAIAWTAYNLAASLPYWPINPSISSNIWFNFQLDLARAFWALLPPTLLWGASFPLALARGRIDKTGCRQPDGAGSTPPTPSEPSSARSARACSWSPGWDRSARSKCSLRCRSSPVCCFCCPRRPLACGSVLASVAAAARRLLDSHRPAHLESAHRARPLRGDLGRQRRYRLRRRRHELVGGRFEFSERRPDLSRRRQDPGFERAARHAAAAHAGTPHDSDRQPPLARSW